MVCRFDKSSEHVFGDDSAAQVALITKLEYSIPLDVACRDPARNAF
jgi:hypothetical protein